MRHKIYYYLLLLFTLSVAGTVAGQTCPGPAVRTALLNLQRANTTLTTNTTTGPRAGQFGLTDTCGNQRYQYYTRVLDSVDCICCNPITTPVVGAPPSAFVKICGTDSIFYIDWKRDPIFLGESLTITQILDSLQNDTAFFNNWYTRDDTTTSLLRTAHILQSAQWLGTDPAGSLLFQMGDLSVGDVFINNQGVTLEYTSTPIGTNTIIAREAGLELTTSETVSRAIFINTDTVNTRGSFDPTNFRLNFNSDNSYLYADSLKVVALGQFPSFPTLAFDGTNKGFFYEPNGGGVYLLNGDGTSANQSNIRLFQTGLELVAATDATFTNNGYLAMKPGNIGFVTQYPPFTYERSGFFSVEQSGIHQVSLREIAAVGDTNKTTTLFLGESNNVSTGYLGRRAFGLSTQIPSEGTPTETYYWLLNFLPNDTTENALSFYNRAYYFPNDRPSNVLNDTSVIVWIGDGTNAGKHPQFVPLPGGGSTVNWYNANGTTTDNSRVATVLETATWLSDNVTFDGIVPFRFEISGHHANEPENMVWAFPSGDSAVIRQADQEIVMFTNAFWLIQSDAATTVQADSFAFNSNAGGTPFRIGQNNVISQNTPTGTPTHRDGIVYNSITGTGQTELFLDGSSAVWRIPTNAVQNFKVHVSAICSAAGNGVGISAGDSYTGWYLGGIKRVGATTSLVGTVQTDATAQSDAGMSTSTVTIDANDTNDSLRIRFTPPSTAGTTTVLQVTASIEIIQTSY